MSDQPDESSVGRSVGSAGLGGWEMGSDGFGVFFGRVRDDVRDGREELKENIITPSVFCVS